MTTKTAIFREDVPLYIQVKDSLAENLVISPLPDDRLPTLKEIAREYGVSVVTAVKAVDELKKSGLIYSRGSKGLYLKDRKRFLQSYAPALKTKTVGLTFLDIYSTTNPFISEFIRGISDECHAHNCHLQLFTTPSRKPDGEANRLFWDSVRAKRLDGLILASRMSVRDIGLLQREGIPFVWINNTLPDSDIVSVLTDKLYNLNLILTHLVNLGHRKISFFSAEEDPDYG